MKGKNKMGDIIARWCIEENDPIEMGRNGDKQRKGTVAQAMPMSGEGGEICLCKAMVGPIHCDGMGGSLGSRPSRGRSGSLIPILFPKSRPLRLHRPYSLLFPMCPQNSDICIILHVTNLWYNEKELRDTNY